MSQSYSSNPTPSLGTSTCHGTSHKKTKKKKELDLSYSRIGYNVVFFVKGVPIPVSAERNLTSIRDHVGSVTGLSMG